MLPDDSSPLIRSQALALKQFACTQTVGFVGHTGARVPISVSCECAAVQMQKPGFLEKPGFDASQTSIAIAGRLLRAGVLQ